MPLEIDRLSDLDRREWLLTNGLGGFASGTVCDAHTRTYHGWLVAALDPPSRRTLLLARIDATLEIAGTTIDLGTNIWKSGTIAPLGYQLLHSFHPNPVPTWVWGQPDWSITRQIVMPYGLLEANADLGKAQFTNQVLIRYRYDGHQAAVLKLRPLIGDRNFHHQQYDDADLSFSQLVEPNRLMVQAKRANWLGTPWELLWTQGHYQPDSVWYWGYRYLEESERGLSDTEDLHSPGYLTVPLQPGEEITLEARVRYPDSIQPYDQLTPQTFNWMIDAEQHRLDRTYAPLFSTSVDDPHSDKLWRQLLKAGDQFFAYRASIASPTIIAGYPWFNDWGRDTLIALPGLTLATHRFSLAKGLLKTFSHYSQDGLVPNAFPDIGTRPFYNSIDAALWWIETLGLYLEVTQDWAFLKEQYPLVQRIYKGLMAGPRYNIRVDALDGLLTWDAPGVALTWMDAVIEGRPVTPRRGKAVEINALWYSALCWMQRWAEYLYRENPTDEKLASQIDRFSRQTQQVKQSLTKFWNPHKGYFYDTIEPNDQPDPSIRPNAVIALSLAHCGFPLLYGKRVMQVACDRLLTPYGLRSLDPDDPKYIGRYTGNLWERDRAYHQGTVWSWLIGPFIRAWQRFHSTESLPWQSELLLEHFQHHVGLGSISEMFDGDAPHAPQGAIAQAWSVAELIRHWQDIHPDQPSISSPKQAILSPNH